MDYADFANFLNEKVQERGLTVKRLSELSGISVKHLEALKQNRVDDLPSAPYLRGYLIRLGQILDFDANQWWEILKKEPAVKSSGHYDEPSKNRFRKEPLKKYFLISAIVLLIVIYLGFRTVKILGQPIIAISSPPDNLTVASRNYVSFNGRVTNADSLIINGEAVSIGQNGEWQKTIALQPGLNTIELVAGKFLGRETKLTRQIIYEPPKNASASIPSIINP